MSDLVALLRAACHENDRLGVTGMLLYRDTAPRPS